MYTRILQYGPAGGITCRIYSGKDSMTINIKTHNHRMYMIAKLASSCQYSTITYSEVRVCLPQRSQFRGVESRGAIDLIFVAQSINYNVIVM